MMPSPAHTRSWPPLGRFAGDAATALALGSVFALAWQRRQIGFRFFEIGGGFGHSLK